MLLKFFPFVALAVSCGGQSASDFYHSKIKETEHIPYLTPMSFSGAGSFVFNKPSSLDVYLPPGNCIHHDIIQNRPLNDRERERIGLALASQGANDIELDNHAAREVFGLLGNGNIVIRIGVKFGDAERVYFKWEDPTINYIDDQSILDYFKYGDVDEGCYDIYRKYPFINSALKVDRLTFRFRNSRGGWMELTSENVGDIVEIGAGIDWEIENNTTLIIETPKHIGYRLGKFSFLGDSISVKHSKATKDDEFLWED